MKGSMVSHALFLIRAVVLALALAGPSWAQVIEHKLTASDGALGDRFGNSVSLSGDRAIVGAFYDNDLGFDSGSAYVYERQGDDSWLEVDKLTASDGTVGDHFGTSVSLSGDRALVGADQDDDPLPNGGSAYVFERQGNGSWLEVAELTASDRAAFDFFGFSVSLSGDRALVGADGNDHLGSTSGSAYVFERQGDGSWLEVAKLNASDGAAGDRFGISVSLSGDHALVGAFWDDNPLADGGSAYVFERQGDGSWLEVDKLTASDSAADDWFGFSVSLSGDRAIVGASAYYDLNPSGGSAYVFERQGNGSWLEVAKLTASDSAFQDYFGRAVSLSWDRAIVGAHRDDDSGSDSGSAYMYERQGDGSWLEVAKLTASDGAEFDYFGTSVSLSGDRAIVGAYFDDDLGSESGAAYVYENLSSPSEAPNLLSPDDGAVFESGDVTFSWTGVANATYYALEISTTLGFESPILFKPTETTLVVTPDELPEDHSDLFYWRVHAGNQIGEGPNSTVRSFTYYIIVANEPDLPTGELPQEYSLLPVYPNPFNSRALVPFAVSEAGHVRLTLDDIFGREVATLLEGQVAAGSHEVVLEGGRLASGVYLVRLEAEGVVHATQKVLLLR